MKLSFPRLSFLRPSFWGVCSRSGLLVLEIVAAVVGLLVLLTGVFMWRLTTGPLDIGFARNYVEEALKENESGYGADIQGAFLSWPRINSPLVLSLRDVTLTRNEASFLNVRELDMGVAVRPLFFGHIRPVSIRLQEPSMRLFRSEQNKFELFLEEEKQAEHLGSEDHMLDMVIDALSREDKDRRNWGPLALLRQFEIIDARMVVEDHKLGLTWYIAPLDLSFARDREGLAITATLELPGGANRASVIVADAIYNPRKSDFVLNLHLQDIDPHALAQKIDALAWFRNQSIVLNGDLTLIADPQGKLKRVGMDLISENGSLNIPELYDIPLGYDEVLVKADYDHENGRFSLENLSLRMNGLEVNAASQMEVSADKISAPITVKVPNLPLETLAGLWPSALNDTSARSWFTERLSVGRLYDGVATINLSAQRTVGQMGQNSVWDVEATDLVADAKMENVSVDYNKPMLPVSAANAVAHIADDKLTIDIQSGKIDELEIKQGKVLITELTSDVTGQADISATLQGPVKSVLRYIGQEPIAFNAEKAGIKTEATQGQATLDVDVSFPTLKDLPVEKVVVKAEAVAQGLLLPGLIKGLDVGGNNINVTVNNGVVNINGPATLQGRPAQADFTAYMDSTGKPFVFQAKSRIVADYELRKQFGAGLEDWLAGDPTINVTYSELQGSKAEVLVDGAVDNVKLLVKPMKYEKAIGVAGTASAKVLLQSGELKEVTDLAINTPDLKIEKGRLVFENVKGQSELRRGQIGRARLTETDVAIDFEQVPGGPIRFKVNGPFFDARPFLGKEHDPALQDTPYTGPAVVANVSVERMRTHPARMVEKAKFYLDMNNKGDVSQFELDATVGTGPLFLRFKPDKSGKMTIHLEAQDAGAVLRAFDVYENVRGGKMKIYGEQVPEKNTRRRLLRGSGEMTDFLVVKAPVLARLVGALSLTGLSELLGGQGISFSRLQSDFDWVVAREGDAYYTRNGRTSGSSVGLTFEGKIDKREDVMDIGGTVVPVTFVNDFISNIPLIGSLLTGGEGALIAATYSVKGPVKTPTVTVNPLSALTPGILRRIFFEEQKADRAPDSMGPMAPKATPQSQQTAPRKPGVNR